MCIAGELLCNDPNELSEEVCDNVDNDCNGEVDEGFPNTDGTGLADCLMRTMTTMALWRMDCIDPAIFHPANKQCGDDGCGGDCGACDANRRIDNQCLCQPDCYVRFAAVTVAEVAVASARLLTQAGQCVCTPNCNGKQCGDNGCVVGGCAGGQICSAGTCITPCTPTGNGIQCGGDGCGGSWKLRRGQICSGGTCITPRTPPQQALQCGGDGCGGSCGAVLHKSCVNNQCVCIPQCNGAQCGGDGCAAAVERKARVLHRWTVCLPTKLQR